MEWLRPRYQSNWTSHPSGRGPLMQSHRTLRSNETHFGLFFCKPLRWSAPPHLLCPLYFSPLKAECSHIRLFIMKTEAAVGLSGSMRCRELGAVMCFAFTCYLFIHLDLNDDCCTFFSYLSFRVQWAFSTRMSSYYSCHFSSKNDQTMVMKMILFIVFINWNSFWFTLHWIINEESCSFLDIPDRTSSVFPTEDILMVSAESKATRIRFSSHLNTNVCKIKTAAEWNRSNVFCTVKLVKLGEKIK